MIDAPVAGMGGSDGGSAGSIAGRGGAAAGRGGSAAGLGGESPGGQGGMGGEGGNEETAGAGGEMSSAACDRAVGSLEIVSLSTSCLAADGDSVFSRLSRDGRYVVFDSDAADLVENDANGKSDVFLRDLETNELELVSYAADSDSPGTGYAWIGAVSDDARHVAMMAMSYDLVTGSVPEGIWVYLRDRLTGSTRRLAADYACSYDVDVSGDAKLVVSEGFTNCRGALEEEDYESVLEHDLSTGATRHLGTINDRTDNYQPAISRDGRFVLWATRPPDTRGEYTSELKLFDRTLDTVQSLGQYSYNFESTDISDDGKVVAFASNGQIYRFDHTLGEVTTVSVDASGVPGDGFSEQVSMSGDGRYLVFRSSSTNLVPGDTNSVADIFLFDYTTKSLERASVAADGTEADDESQYPSIAPGGTRLSFSSKARNLVPESTAGNFQTYVRRIPF